jgi:hypothetical protein
MVFIASKALSLTKIILKLKLTRPKQKATYIAGYYVFTPEQKCSLVPAKSYAVKFCSAGFSQMTQL